MALVTDTQTHTQLRDQQCECDRQNRQLISYRWPQHGRCCLASSRLCDDWGRLLILRCDDLMGEAVRQNIQGGLIKTVRI